MQGQTWKGVPTQKSKRRTTRLLSFAYFFNIEAEETKRSRCLGGGTGRRKGLKIPRALCLYEFDSRPGHQQNIIEVEQTHLDCQQDVFIF